MTAGQRRVVEWAGIAAAYYLTGRLGLLAAIPPGFSTAVWPPSGIALAAVWVFGFSAWPGVWAGAFLVNLGVAHAATSGSLTHLVATNVVIATGSTLQALFGGWLLRRAVGNRNPLERPEAVIRFIAVAPLACLIAPSIGVGELWLGALLTNATARSNWFTWWLGDTVGVLVMSPLVFVATLRAQVAWSCPRVLEAAALAVSLLSAEAWLFAGVTSASPGAFGYVLIPFVVWAAWRFDVIGTVVAVALLAATAAWGASSGRGPFQASSLASTLLATQAFMGLVAVIGLVMSSALRQIRADEQTLRASDAQLSMILNNASDVIFAVAVEPDGDFRFRSVNRRFLDATGLAATQVVGARIADVIPEPARSFVLDKYREAVRTRTAVHWEEVSEYPSGRKVGHVTMVPVSDGGTCKQLVGMVHDVTPQIEAAHALQESERKYRDLVELSNSIILRWGRDGRVTFLNEFGQRFFGYSAEEIVGRHVMTTIVPASDSDGRDMGEFIEEICADPVAFERSVNENVRRNGERVWVAWTNRVVRDEAGEVVEILSIGTDITELKRAQDEIRDLNTGLERRVAERTGELVAAKEEAESADQLKSVFLATMSHELRTPLNSIIGFSGILRQGLAGPLNEEQQRQMGMVCKSAEHLLELINDVLDISKIEAGQLQLYPEPFDLRASVSGVAGVVAPLANKKGVALEIEVAPEVGQLVGDRRRVEQVLLNLLSNAIKFTDQGRVRVEVSAVVQRVQVLVSDTGIGILPADQANLFKPFTQVDAGLNRTREGTGLGLSICKHLVEMQGGRIWVTSERGTGSTFGFDLPLRGAAQ